MVLIKPVLKPILSAVGVLLGWSWQGFGKFLDALEILVDCGDGHGYVAHTIDTTPNYFDTAPMPAAPAKWTYQAVFRVGEQRVGQWNDPVSVMVG